MNIGIKDLFEQGEEFEGLITANPPSPKRLWRDKPTTRMMDKKFTTILSSRLRQYLLTGKVEKIRISQKTWYRVIFHARKFEPAAN
jgi:hypothetical protein